MSAARLPGPMRWEPWSRAMDAGTLALCRMPEPATVGRAPVSARALPAGAGSSRLAEAAVVLRRGDQGALVTQLQMALRRVLPGISLRVDGDFGPATEHAVRRLQATRALAVDGVVGPRTWRALLRPADAPADADHVASPRPSPTPAGSASNGSPGDASAWMQIARGEIGQAEVARARANPRIVAYHATIGLRAASDEIAWCSSFVNWVLRQAGLPGTDSAAAASWIGWGRACEPVAGAVMVIHNAAAARSSLTVSGNHVGFLVEQSDTHWVLLGGNQSDQVKESRFRRSSWALRASRWPA